MNAKNVNVLLGIIVVVLCATVVYLLYMNSIQQETIRQFSLYEPIGANPKSEQKADNSNAAANSDTATTMADWKTYSNPTYGIEFKYPNNFKPDACGDSCAVMVVNEQEDTIHIAIFPEKFDPNNIEGVFGPVGTPDPMPIGNKTGYSYMEGDGGCGGLVVATALGSSTLQVSFNSCENGVENRPQFLYENEALIEEILSTFKFTK